MGDDRRKDSASELRRRVGARERIWTRVMLWLAVAANLLGAIATFWRR